MSLKTLEWTSNRTSNDHSEYISDENQAFEDYDEIVWNAVAPNWLEYGSLGVFALLLIIGLVGNFLVIFVVFKNESMRTVTNYFLVNLALADFMVLLFCLPFTVLWEITKTWWFGTALCKVIVYWQTVSVSVSVLTLTCISVERWYAICRPLSFKNTIKRTRILLIIIWISAFLLSLPEILILQAKPLAFAKANYTSSYLTQCTHTWDDSFQQAYQLAQTFALYVLPVSMMAAMYGHIAYVLWVKSIPPSDSSCASRRHSNISSNTADFTTSSKKNTSRVTFSASTQYLPMSTRSTSNEKQSEDRLKPPSESFGHVINAFTKSVSPDQWKEREIMNRKKAAKMLIAVVILFAICYLPTHVLNILTYFGAVPDLKLGLQRSAMYLSIRLLCYFNSCINPIVYNFMSERFQKEFRRVCFFPPLKYGRNNAEPSQCTASHETSALLVNVRTQVEKCTYKK